eukprot:TRINITY_DN1051_c1_g1_i1.p1 TRINITY_DN1051_c1_g1~~TRINITY_DN1051_c1_g1_i1.p1  ORF type:complete len:1227 (+),score=252.29 TRINITY_DN1051_c1_g1_i1:430-3681(+)
MDSFSAVGGTEAPEELSQMLSQEREGAPPSETGIDEDDSHPSTSGSSGSGGQTQNRSPPITAETWEPEVGSAMGQAEGSTLRGMLRGRTDCFAFGLKDLGSLKGQELRIDLDDDRPVFRRPYRHSQAERDMIRDRCGELREAAIIERGFGEYAAATVMPSKKDIYGRWTEKRMCGDYRPHNRKSKSDRYPMPTPEELFDSLGQASVFSTLDLRSGYHQLPIREEDRPKTAFWGVDEHGRDCLYQWKYLPFGLKNAPAEFQRVMDRILSGLDFARCYIDDIIVYSSSPEEHIRHIEQVLERLREHGLKLHPGKCRFGERHIEYLGHMVHPGGLGVQQAKVEAIEMVPRPEDVSRLRAFLGLAGYYRRFVQGYSTIAKPLTLLTRLDQPYEWGEAQEGAFRKLKERLVSAPILGRPRGDRPFTLHTDWSAVGLGAVLTQQDDEGREYVVAYASRSNNSAESRYSSYEGECLAAVWAVAHFRCYLYGREFTLVTDHQPLRWLMENDKLTGKLARWALILQEYDFQVVHRAGVTNQDADGLSRNPLPQDTDSTGVRWHTSPEEDQAEVPGWHASAFLCALAGELVVVDEDGEAMREEERQTGSDVWEDEILLGFLRGGEMPGGLTPSERDRVRQRSRRFRMEGEHLLRVFTDGRVLIVPRPETRPGLMRRAHEELGHFGVRRTHSLLQTQYWWRGMQQQVQELIARCVVCDRVRASFNSPSPQLQPLPIMGLGYRWSLDFAGPLPTTARHNRYVLVMVEHFSKWIELVALPDKTSRGAAQAFVDRVLSRFGAPAEVLTDQGGEFLGEFQEMCEVAMIDHRQTSRDHPEADGLAERVVQTVKRGLRKYGLVEGRTTNWDLQLPWLAMGYRFSRQASLASFSPYFLLFGVHPHLPGTIRREAEQVLADRLDDPEMWIAVVEQRADLMRRAMPMAFENLKIAQHRDTLRYATIRGGGYRPRVRRFQPGDYVYLQQTAGRTLDVTAGRVVLRVKALKPSGVLLLEGRDGGEWEDHARNCAPCHLPDIEGTVDPSLRIAPASLRCMACGETTQGGQMVLCDRCQRGWHTFCLRPPLEEIPAGSWTCPRCTGT